MVGAHCHLWWQEVSRREWQLRPQGGGVLALDVRPRWGFPRVTPCRGLGRRVGLHCWVPCVSGGWRADSLGICSEEVSTTPRGARVPGVGLPL